MKEIVDLPKFGLLLKLAKYCRVVWPLETARPKSNMGEISDKHVFERIFHSLICTGWNRLVKNGPCATLSDAYALAGINKQELNRNEC